MHTKHQKRKNLLIAIPLVIGLLFLLTLTNGITIYIAGVVSIHTKQYATPVEAINNSLQEEVPYKEDNMALLYDVDQYNALCVVVVPDKEIFIAHLQKNGGYVCIETGGVGMEIYSSAEENYSVFHLISNRIFFSSSLKATVIKDDAVSNYNGWTVIPLNSPFDHLCLALLSNG